MILENVVALQQTDGPEQQSDSNYIIEVLQELGYAAGVYEVEASDYGSRCRRKRFYFVASLLRVPGSPSVQEFLTTIAGTPSPLGWENYLLPHPTMSDVLPPAPDPRPAAKQRAQERTPRYEDEHMNMYYSFGLNWPPLDSDINSIFKQSCAGPLSQRAREVVYFCHVVFSGPAHLQPGVPDFLDANTSMQRLKITKEKENNPWSKDIMPTLVGSMVPVIRTMTEDGDVTIRTLSGVECMQIMGWDMTYYANPQETIETCKNEVLVKLAGNAFNAFACGAVFVVSLPFIDWDSAAMLADGQDHLDPTPSTELIDGECLSD